MSDPVPSAQLSATGMHQLHIYNVPCRREHLVWKRYRSQDESHKEGVLGKRQIDQVGKSQK